MTVPTEIRDEHRIPVIDLETERRGFIFSDADRKALCEWVEAHGLSPNDIVAATGITRDADACCIRYVEFVRNEDGQRMLDPAAPYDEPSLLKRATVEQGEAPPLPLPEFAAFRPLSGPTKGA